jgi:hypothetical protein
LYFDPGSSSSVLVKKGIGARNSNIPGSFNNLLRKPLFLGNSVLGLAEGEIQAKAHAPPKCMGISVS